MKIAKPCLCIGLGLFLCLGQPVTSQESMPANPAILLRVGQDQKKATKINDAIFQAIGTQPRWALDYVNSLNKVLALKPEILLPSHGMAIFGNEEITKRVTRYRDAIQYVHDETVKGMNAGKDVWTLMNGIKLPPQLDIGESYGKLSWSVRGIYEGYVGWFDLNPATMYEKPVASVYADVVKMAGGADAVAKLAMERAQAGQAVEALHLSDLALATDAIFHMKYRIWHMKTASHFA